MKNKPAVFILKENQSTEREDKTGWTSDNRDQVKFHTT